MSLKFLGLLWFATTLLSPCESVYAGEPTLDFKISPQGTRLRSQGQPVTLIVTVSASDSRPAVAGWVALRLEAPASSRFFCTDFPRIEGTKLLEMELPIVDGKAEWHQVFPIRGEYVLTAEFSGPGTEKIKKVFRFHVDENQWKWLALGGFALGLFITGVIAGRIFTAPKHETGAKLALWLLLISACGAVICKTAWAAGEQRHRVSKLEVKSAVVGAPARIHWSLGLAGGNGKPWARLTLAITQMEKNQVIFSLQKIPVAGEFTMRYQFTDGSEHRITAVAETDDGETLRQERLISVTAVAPPLGAKLRALLFFLAIIAAGLAVGRWSR